ncbi:cell division protein DedD [Candidatus Nomurabacteria bacterium RIFCSPHIGHO2_02_FULL_33_12]|uniref:Cell division protein DedD n=1 Tax=Candidatus Nomurabacteria bacterium RIFCSPLOWO2_01_FULL_33_17 TaxID=1801764 RepID=A0A1F6WNM5_9BACT|nr:MAG: cell division protein DedD [Candidatus Nomurabacteria bacterium RIFCSPHIGHO2_02_FULL_33_12]OGI83480.1 MAG: cell division protein DedD [Candidatus Nomurabacteria bacterium RIFCSPLOWO2_01_FULL_33_17]
MTDIHKRPSWDEYFLALADMVGSRGTCDRGRSGCVITKDKRILTTGYVGAPIGLPHCDEVGHEMHKVMQEDGTESNHCVRTAHAEQNAINNSARDGVAIKGSTLYCKMTPCFRCAQSIVNSGIIRVVAMKDYHAGKKSKEILKQAGVEFTIIDESVESYKNQ